MNLMKNAFNTCFSCVKSVSIPRIDIFASDIALDLGTANNVVYARGKGILFTQPAVIALKSHKGSYIPYAFGQEAKLMIGKTPPEIKVVRPLRDGVIADFRSAEEMIKNCIRRVSGKRINNPRIIICVPFGSTPVERRAIHDAAEGAGAREVFLVEEPMAAAIGADLPVTDPIGCMMIDIGGGTTEVAVISLGGIVYGKSVRVGGDKIDLSIQEYIRRHHNLLIGEFTAEKIKKEIGTAKVLSDDEKKEFFVKGRDLLEGIPKEIRLTSADIADSIQDPVNQIVEAVRVALEHTPPELSSDIVDRGIKLSGGGALLKNLDVVIKNATGLPVSVANDPLSSVASGTGRILEDMSKFKHVLFKQDEG